MQTNNKLRISKWRTVLSFLVVLCFAGCSEEDLGMDKNTIAFDCSTSDLRATKATAEDMQYFRVSAVWDKGIDGSESFMDNQLVEKQAGGWVYSPVKYWPGTGSVSFFAYSPAISSGLKSFLIDDAADQVTIEYQLSTDDSKQEDFMLAASLFQTSSPVLLTFQHALSVAKFCARSSEAGVAFRIKEIKLAKLASKGLVTGLDLDASSTITWMWYEPVDLEEYVVYQKYPFETEEGEYREVGSIMVLPQELLSSDFKIIVTYNVVGVSGDNTIEYELGDGFTFEMNKRYTFFIDLDSQSASGAPKQDVAMPELKYHVATMPLKNEYELTKANKLN